MGSGSSCLSLVSFCPLELDQVHPSSQGGGAAPFQSCPGPYHRDLDLEADTKQTWNLLWGGGSSEPANQGRWGDVRW